MAGDPYFNQVSLLLPMTGGDGSTSVPDASNNGYTVTAANGAQVDTAQADPFSANDGVGMFDGSNDYLAVTRNAVNGYSAALTMEGWFYCTSSTSRALFGTYRNVAGANYGFYVSKNSSNQLSLVGYPAGASYSVFLINVGSFPINNWNHVAVVRQEDGVWKIYINGTAVGSYAENSTIIDESGANFRIGAYPYAVDPNFQGYISNFRVTKGVARYTANFTVPLEPFPLFGYPGYISGSLTESLASVYFHLFVYVFDTGELVGEGVVEAPSYSVDVLSLEPVYIVIKPEYGAKWTARAFAVDDLVYPTEPTTTPYAYKITGGGTAVTEPAWPTTPGATVSQDGVTYECVEAMTNPQVRGPLTPTAY